MVRKIVVAGDVTIDWLQWAIKPENIDEYSPNWQIYPGFKKIALGGGTVLTTRGIKSALPNKGIKVFGYNTIRSLEKKTPNEIIHSVSTLKKYKGEKGNKWRVCEFIGFSGPDNGFPEPLTIKNDQIDADLLVLDDAGNGFRDNELRWPKALTRDGEKPITVLKMCRPLMRGKLWNLLYTQYDEKLVVMINANDLRDYGVKISKKLSWEQTAEDFLSELKNNPEIYLLQNCKHLIVRFGIEGVIHYCKTSDGGKATLYYDSKSYEDYYGETTQGDMQGFGCIFVASLSSYIAEYSLNKISEGILDGMKRCRLLLENGFIKSGDKMDYPMDIFQKSCSQNIYCVNIPLNNHDQPWTIMESIKDLNIESLAFHYVLKGENIYLDMVPMGRFGGLVTIDRNEIEGYQSIRNLMEEYMAKYESDKPLSIAVFGPPGSGKSFGVVQLAKSISKDKIEKMEFNVSQFQSPNDLIKAFHRVRDVALKGIIPLVFFDEFDASVGEENLPWLKYFLAPMQDGEFKDGETVHPIGKSIFVFAGGTSNTFKEFSREDKDQNIRDKFRSVKGTDFVSRLRGYVNIIGPDPVADDKFFIMRRALLLRSLLENSAPNISDSGKIQIDPGVLWAFLQIGRYKHGVRSMQAIIDMSQLSGQKKYEQSALPSKEQLKMHVKAEEFLELVTKKSAFYRAIERMAKQIHKNYCKLNPEAPPWEELTEVYRESNRLQAEHIPVKLKALGFNMRRVSKEPKKFEFNKSQIEILAVLEHDRWMQEKRLNGWRLGEKKDEDKKIHPDLVEWDELSKKSKKYDRDAVGNIPDILAEAGFEVYK